MLSKRVAWIQHSSTNKQSSMLAVKLLKGSSLQFSNISFSGLVLLIPGWWTTDFIWLTVSSVYHPFPLIMSHLISHWSSITSQTIHTIFNWLWLKKLSHMGVYRNSQLSRSWSTKMSWDGWGINVAFRLLTDWFRWPLPLSRSASETNPFFKKWSYWLHFTLFCN